MDVRHFSDYKPVFNVQMNDIINLIMKNEEVQQSIIEYNQEQLQQGKDAEGIPIRTIVATLENEGHNYAKYTIHLKAEKGQQSQLVTLEDTGEFYASMKVKVNRFNNEVLADFEKPDGDIRDNFVPAYDFLGLTDENLKGFATWIISDYLGLELRKQFGLQ